MINKPEYDTNIVNNLYIAIQNSYCTIEKIDGSRERYLVIDKYSEKKKKLFNKLHILLLIKLNIQENDSIFDDNIIKNN